MPPTPPAPQPLSDLTVTCRQCGAADMLRLDRKEYKCRHCGAITVISDNDAERLEQLLQQLLAKQSVRPQPVSGRRRLVAAAFGLLAFAAVIAAGALLTSRSRAGYGTNAGATYLDEQSVPNDKLVLSSLAWQPDGDHGGSYTGILYNHSGYAVMPPNYSLNLFHNGMKDTSSLSSLGLVSTLEPGEYMPVNFRYDSGKPAQRYEVEQPAHIMRSTMEVAPVALRRPVLIHTQGSGLYALVGSVRNDLRRPIRGIGELMIYGKDGQIVASGVGSFNKLRPGEATTMTFNAFTYTGEIQVAAYEYLLDASYENESQTITLDEWQKAGRRTVPNRIVRVNAPAVRIMPDGQDWKPEDMVQERQ